MQTRRIAWTMLAVSIYLGLFTGDTGPTVPVQASDSQLGGTDAEYECIVIGADGRVTVDPEDCTTSAASPD